MGGGTLSFFHNPNLIHSEKDGKYYLYFVFRSSGSSQKVGVAYADTPAGTWTIKEDPVITTREGYHDNPSVIELKDENGNYSYYAVYRSNGTEDGVTIRAGAYATADSPLGPFIQSEERIMYDPDSEYSVEDCHVWFENGQYYALAKDMTGGNITGYTDGSSTALYESTDGVNWTLSENKLAYPTIIPWESGDQKVGLMDRAYVYMEKGVPIMLTNATSDSSISPNSNAVDGKADVDTTRWSANNADTGEVTLEIDLGGSYVIDSFIIDEFSNRIASFDWEYFDGSEWQVCHAGDVSTRVAGSVENHYTMSGELGGVTAEKVRLVIHSSTKGPSIWELKVYGTKIYSELAGGKEVEVSSVYSNESVGTYPAENAVDGDLTTRWAASNATGTVTFDIKLGNNYYIEDFKITEFKDRITSYNWQYHDGSRWNTCYEGTNADAVAGETNIVYLSDEFTTKAVTNRCD